MKNKLALVTGSFDPFTVGHFDIVSRAAKIFDSVIVLVAHNEEKTYMFSSEERVAITKKAVEAFDNVTVELCDGYVADFARECGASAFVRGIRGSADVAYEQNMADINFANSGVDTVMLFTKPEYHSISSTAVRAAIVNGETIESLVPVAAEQTILNFYKSKI